MPKPEPFPCAQCGECCRHIGGIPQLAHFDSGEGVCIHLKDNLCDIYADRPDICRVDEMYSKYFSKLYSQEEYYRLNLNACKLFMKGV